MGRPLLKWFTYGEIVILRGLFNGFSGSIISMKKYKGKNKN